MKLTYLFRTSESDSSEVYKNEEGEYFARRYGMPTYPISYDYAKQLAWFQLNRLGKFPSEMGADGIRHITWTEEQQNNAVNSLLEFTPDSLQI